MLGFISIHMMRHYREEQAHASTWRHCFNKSEASGSFTYVKPARAVLVYLEANEVQPINTELTFFSTSFGSPDCSTAVVRGFVVRALWLNTGKTQ
jgi:hypothetical protein